MHSIGYGISQDWLCLFWPWKSLFESRVANELIKQKIAISMIYQQFCRVSWSKKKTMSTGDYGKLGHGNTSTQKTPKLLLGPLSGKIVVNVSAGYRHSACVCEVCGSFTWFVPACWSETCLCLDLEIVPKYWRLFTNSIPSVIIMNIINDNQ